MPAHRLGLPSQATNCRPRFSQKAQHYTGARYVQEFVSIHLREYPLAQFARKARQCNRRSTLSNLPQK